MSEQRVVQEPMVRYAEQIGWERLTAETAQDWRGGPEGKLLDPVLVGQLLRLNPDVLNEDRAAEVVRRLKLIRPDIEGNREALRWMRGERSVFVDEENRERNVKLIDFDEPDKNELHVTAEWTQKGAAHTNRADVVLCINGLPVAVAETKRADKRDGLEEGMDQVRRYHRQTPDLFLSSQVFNVSELAHFWYGGTWATSRRGLFDWKDEHPEAAGEGYAARVKAFFEPERFLRVLRDYILFVTKDERLEKLILRPHQTRAVEKVVERAGDPHKRRGLVWHTQGSGKTLTMITVASKLLQGRIGDEKPMVLMLVDRNELQAQLFRNIEGYGIGTVEVADSKRDLQRILGRDYRGLVVSMIHKFDGIPADVNSREGVVVLVDEAHRTTGGDLGNYLMAALPNATYIGFTGTPIDNLSHGKGTFKVFGSDDGAGYLDKYSIRESIEDGTTVQLNYALAPAEMRVDRDTLEQQFMKQADAEGVSDVDELNAVLDRAVKLKTAMKSPRRMERVARAVAEHFRENVEPMGFKAFLVAVDREACALYKQLLDEHLPPEWSEVVMSGGHNDSDLLRRHHLSDDEEKQLRKRFARKGDLPKVFIVTEKLLTGFDAPILYAMYLDKPMRDHVLLQAIARVNRPYEDEDGLVKPCGFVLDFVGIFEKLEQALAFDSDVVESVIENIDVLRNLFETMMREQAPPYLILPARFSDRDADAAIVRFERKEDRDEFYKFFRRLQNVYDILSPDAFLGPYIDDVRRLSELYGLLRNAYDNTYADRELTRKTRELLREHTAAENLRPPGAIHELGPEQLEALKRSDTSDTSKVLNLRKVLAETVAQDDGAQPFLIPIGDRAEQLAERYRGRQLSTQEALEGFMKLGEDAAGARAQKDKIGLSDNAYAIYVAMKPVGNGLQPDQARELDELFERFPDYQWDQQQRSDLRLALYKAVRPIVGPTRMIDAANAILQIPRS